MNMKYPIDLQKRIYSSIVPVECGDEKGTAFFVTPDTLVTARHVVADKEIAENGGYPPTQNGDIRSLFWLFSLMALQN